MTNYQIDASFFGGREFLENVLVQIIYSILYLHVTSL